jgi:hypothetical protein
MPIAPDINIKQANKYSGDRAGELSLKKRTFHRNRVSVKVLTLSLLLAGTTNRISSRCNTSGAKGTRRHSRKIEIGIGN